GGGEKGGRADPADGPGGPEADAETGVGAAVAGGAGAGVGGGAGGGPAPGAGGAPTPARGRRTPRFKNAGGTMGGRGSRGRGAAIPSNLTANAVLCLDGCVMTSPRYELSDAQWHAIQEFLPANGRRGKQWKDHRLVIDGILWALADGGRWRNLPEKFGKWQT